MANVSVVGFFCEDIREEKSGQDTIIGILPDNYKVPSLPGLTPKLCGYCRMHLEIQSKFTDVIKTRLVGVNQSDIELGIISQDIIDNSMQEALRNGMPYAGLITKVVLSPFSVQKQGLVQLIVTIGAVDYVAAALNIVVAKPA